MRYVIDASVVTKTMAREKGSAKAKQILHAGALGEVRLSAPAVLIYEVGIALTRKGFKNRTLVDKFKKLSILSDLIIDIVEPDATLMAEAAAMAQIVSPIPDIKPWFNDCLYFVLARHQEASFLTADKSFVARVRLFTQFQTEMVLLRDIKL